MLELSHRLTVWGGVGGGMGQGGGGMGGGGGQRRGVLGPRWQYGL